MFFLELDLSPPLQAEVEILVEVDSCLTGVVVVWAEPDPQAEVLRHLSPAETGVYVVPVERLRVSADPALLLSLYY